jgi:hypothetical protein
VQCVRAKTSQAARTSTLIWVNVRRDFYQVENSHGAAIHWHGKKGVEGDVDIGF